MAVNDLVADMISRVRNGLRSKQQRVDVLPSKLVASIAQVLVEAGYLKAATAIGEKASGRLRLELKYGPNGEDVVRELRRVSKPGRRVYVPAAEVPVVNNGLGIAVLSTPKGVMSSVRARREKIGGEILCVIE